MTTAELRAMWSDLNRMIADANVIEAEAAKTRGRTALARHRRADLLAECLSIRRDVAALRDKVEQRLKGNERDDDGLSPWT